MNMKKLFLILAISVLLISSVSCASVPKDTGDFECEFDTKSKTVTITGYNGDSDEITVPEKFDNYTVTSIGWSAFSKNYDVEKITLPETIQAIEASAFEYCISLESINLPKSLKSIGNTAFLNCRGLLNIPIGENIESIGIGAFSGCTSLDKIIVNENNKKYSSDSYGVLLDKEQKTILQYPAGSMSQSYNMPDSVVEIAGYAFEKSEWLEEVDFSSSLKKIGSCAFQASGILEASFGDSLEEIGFSCFNESKLNSISLGNNVKKIGESAFSWCTSLSEIYIPASVVEIGQSAFYMCTAIKGFEVDKDNKNYTSDVYGVLFDKNMTVLHYYPIARIDEGYFVPDTVVTIGANAFSPTLNLKTIHIPDSVENIEEKAFSDCVNLTEVIYDGSRPSNIADNAFN